MHVCWKYPPLVGKNQEHAKSGERKHTQMVGKCFTVMTELCEGGGSGRITGWPVHTHSVISYYYSYATTHPLSLFFTCSHKLSFLDRSR
eukprot:c44084_g1_i1 orf=127-393(+)